MRTTNLQSANKIPLMKPVFDEEMRRAAIEALASERFVLGESVSKFEEEFARYCGVKYAVSTASGTSAIMLSLLALGVRGGEVITTPHSFVASANSIVHAYATPRFADITLATYTIDPREVAPAISERTRALLPVHLYGFPAAMNELCQIAARRGIPIVEDACQAHGASYEGKKVGSIGHAGCFSFYPSKNMTVGGDGGMVVTDDEAMAKTLSSLRDCGRIRGEKYLHDQLGFTERLNTVQAAIGRIQLRRLDEWNDKRRAIAAKYSESLSDLDEVTTPTPGSGSERPVYHLYAIRCDRRDELRSWLQLAGIETGIHYQEPIHLQPIYRKMFGYQGGEFPRSEQVCKQILSIPMYPELTDEDMRFISESIHEFYGK